GQRLYVSFGAAGFYCYDLDGKLLWKRQLRPMPHRWGTASSPVLFGQSVIQLCDTDGPSFLVALDCRTGEVLWRTTRDPSNTWSTPLVVAVENGEPELVTNSMTRVIAYDPRTGKELWSCRGMTDIVCPTPVAGNGLVYCVSGRNGPALAIRPGGHGDVTDTHVAWRARRGAPYVPSPILYRDRLYMVNDGGNATCYDALSGKLIWQTRLPGQYTASPVAADGKLYFTSEEGQTVVLEAGDKPLILATNDLGETCLASPAVADGRLYFRTEQHLYCFGNSDEDRPHGNQAQPHAGTGS
ncbi:MAG: PQQ-like beta-propeller repeat protein, partial [Planctomycetes bacterium]|nr:PQQ-like beta-propeller repeat protein [Planctomycetota bacterium]